MPHEYLGGETPCERLTGKYFNYDRLRAWGSECYVHQDKQQRGASAKSHPYAKRGKIMGHDRTSLCWHIWLPQEAKLVTSAQVTLEPDKHIMDFVGERETMTSTDDSESEDDSDRDSDITVDPIPLSSPSGQRMSARIAEQPRVDYRGLLSGDTEELGENIVNLLRSSTDDAYCLMGMASDISIGHQEPSTITLDQHFYAESIVREGMGSAEVRNTSSPLNPGMDLTARRTDEEELDERHKPYRTILGKLMFLAGMTRPDISNSERELGRYAASPCDRHWKGLQHVLRYLLGTTKVGIHYPAGGEMDNGGLVSYGDSDWVFKTMTLHQGGA
ncbi:unnamed protein product [Choristocarpus tenellus]